MIIWFSLAPMYIYTYTHTHIVTQQNATTLRIFALRLSGAVDLVWAATGTYLNNPNKN